MDTFHETRWRMPLPWLLLSVILIVASFMDVPSGGLYYKWFTRLAAAATCFWATWKCIYPGKAVVFEDGWILIKGVRPGWWKLFQRWIWVRISDEQVEDIRLGRVREESFLQKSLPPAGEPSRGSMLQSFLWIRYRSAEGKNEIYYPEIHDIQDSQLLVAKLRDRFGERVITF